MISLTSKLLIFLKLASWLHLLLTSQHWAFAIHGTYTFTWSNDHWSTAPTGSSRSWTNANANTVQPSRANNNRVLIWLRLLILRNEWKNRFPKTCRQSDRQTWWASQSSWSHVCPYICESATRLVCAVTTALSQQIASKSPAKRSHKIYLTATGVWRQRSVELEVPTSLSAGHCDGWWWFLADGCAQ